MFLLDSSKVTLVWLWALGDTLILSKNMAIKEKNCLIFIYRTKHLFETAASSRKKHCETIKTRFHFHKMPKFNFVAFLHENNNNIETLFINFSSRDTHLNNMIYFEICLIKYIEIHLLDEQSIEFEPGFVLEGDFAVALDRWYIFRFLMRKRKNKNFVFFHFNWFEDVATRLLLRIFKKERKKPLIGCFAMINCRKYNNLR